MIHTPQKDETKTNQKTEQHTTPYNKRLAHVQLKQIKTQSQNLIQGVKRPIYSYKIL